MEDKYRLVVRIRVEREGQEVAHAFGKGTAMLLQGIEAHKSLNKSAKSIGMSYSKAWKSINATEAHLGFKLIERNGRHGSLLTEQGRQFLQRYVQAEKAALAAAEKFL